MRESLIFLYSTFPLFKYFYFCFHVFPGNFNVSICFENNTRSIFIVLKIENAPIVYNLQSFFFRIHFKVCFLKWLLSKLKMAMKPIFCGRSTCCKIDTFDMSFWTFQRRCKVICFIIKCHYTPKYWCETAAHYNT